MAGTIPTKATTYGMNVGFFRHSADDGYGASPYTQDPTICVKTGDNATWTEYEDYSWAQYPVVALYGQFDYIRVLNLMEHRSFDRRTAWSNRIKWADRSRWDRSSGTRYGLPLEALIALANQCGSQLSWPFPSQSNTDYMYNAGVMFARLYEPSVFWLEGPNEVWNGDSGKIYRENELDFETGGFKPNDFGGNYNLIWQRHGQDFKRKQEAFVNGFNSVNRASLGLGACTVKRIIAGQTANSGVLFGGGGALSQLSYPQDYDGYYLACYFGDNSSNPNVYTGTSHSQTVTRAINNMNAYENGNYSTNGVSSDSIPHGFYEGGAHFGYNLNDFSLVDGAGVLAAWDDVVTDVAKVHADGHSMPLFIFEGAGKRYANGTDNNNARFSDQFDLYDGEDADYAPFNSVVSALSLPTAATVSYAGDVIPPTLASASITEKGAKLKLTFSETIANSTGITLTVDAVSNSLSSPVVSGSTITYTVTGTIYYDETVLVSYTPGNIVDSDANALPAFSDVVVQTYDAGDDDLSAGIPTYGTDEVLQYTDLEPDGSYTPGTFGTQDVSDGQAPDGLVADYNGLRVRRDGYSVVGLWENFTTDLTTALSAWRALNGGGSTTIFNGRTDRGLYFDSSGVLYTMVQVGTGGSAEHFVLWSTDTGKTFTAERVSNGYNFARMEANDYPSPEVFNNPPCIILFNNSGALELVTPTISAGVVSIPASITITNTAIASSFHTGFANSATSILNNKIAVAWASTNAPPGGVGSDQLVSIIDRDTQAVESVTYVATSDNVDTADGHDNPAITQTREGPEAGTLHMVVGTHHGNMYYVKTTDRNDLTSWGTPHRFGERRTPVNDSGGSAGHTYIGMVQDTLRRIHFVTRFAGDSGYKFRLVYNRRNEDGSWETQKNLIDPNRGNYSNAYFALQITGDEALRLVSPGFLFDQLSSGEAATYDGLWSGELPAGPPYYPDGGWAGPYDDQELHGPFILLSTDGGANWSTSTLVAVDPATEIYIDGSSWSTESGAVTAANSGLDRVSAAGASLAGWTYKTVTADDRPKDLRPNASGGFVVMETTQPTDPYTARFNIGGETLWANGMTAGGMYETMWVRCSLNAALEAADHRDTILLQSCQVSGGKTVTIQPTIIKASEVASDWALDDGLGMVAQLNATRPTGSTTIGFPQTYANPTSSSYATPIIRFGEWFKITIAWHQHASQGRVDVYINDTLILEAGLWDSTSEVIQTQWYQHDYEFGYHSKLNWEVAPVLSSTTLENGEPAITPRHDLVPKNSSITHALPFLDWLIDPTANDVQGTFWKPVTTTGSPTLSISEYASSGNRPFSQKYSAASTGSSDRFVIQTRGNIGTLPYRSSDGWATICCQDIRPSTDANIVIGVYDRDNQTRRARIDIDGTDVSVNGTDTSIDLTSGSHYHVALHLNASGACAISIIDLTNNTLTTTYAYSASCTGWSPGETGVIEVDCTFASSAKTVWIGTFLVCETWEIAGVDSLLEADTFSLSPAYASPAHVGDSFMSTRQNSFVPGGRWCRYNEWSAIGQGRRGIACIVGRSGQSQERFKDYCLAGLASTKGARLWLIDGGSVNDVSAYSTITDAATAISEADRMNTDTEAILEQWVVNQKNEIWLDTMHDRPNYSTWSADVAEFVDLRNAGILKLAKKYQRSNRVAFSDTSAISFTTGGAGDIHPVDEENQENAVAMIEGMYYPLRSFDPPGPNPNPTPGSPNSGVSTTSFRDYRRTARPRSRF